MSVERSFEAWEEVQRHAQDLANRLAQGFTGFIQSHTSPLSFPWPNPQPPKIFDAEFPTKSFAKQDFGRMRSKSTINGISAILGIGNKLGQVRADLGAHLNGMVQQFYSRLPLASRRNETSKVSLQPELKSQGNDAGAIEKDSFGPLAEQFKDFDFAAIDSTSDGQVDEEFAGFDFTSVGHFARSQALVSISSTYDSRSLDIESSVVARGDLWRIEASHGGSTPGNVNSPLFLVQLGPVLFIRDTTLLLPVHLSKQHLLWYGYDRKNGMHSLCPAVWSKHRRWLVMSMICFNPLVCSFVDLQFPNGQLTYISGEGLTTSTFLPFCGGLLQAQGQYPGEMRFSFSCKNKWGTRITPMVQWPDKSFTLDLSQALTWNRSGPIMRPTIQLSVCPTFGGSNPGLQTELIHSVKENLHMICGCATTSCPSAFASLSLGRSKWNGNVGSTGIVVKVEKPLSAVGRPSFSVQFNTGLEL